MQSPFFSTQADRVALARQRYFEEGEPPSGVVGDAVFQSWARCQRQKQDPRGRLEFQSVSASRAQLALQKNRLLNEAWLAQASELAAVLGATNCGAMLTDPRCVLIGATGAHRVQDKITPVAHRIGVNFSEAALGTTAPGIVAHTGKQVCVQGAEHYFERVNTMHCAAAPIRDIYGKLAGVLDISSEGMAFNFDAATVVGLYASSIENRLLLSQSNEHLIVRFQLSPALLNTPMVGLIGVDMQGRVAWKNAIAAKLLGLRPDSEQPSSPLVEALLDNNFSALASVRTDQHCLLRLSNGLQVYACCALQVGDGYTQLIALGPLAQKAPLSATSPSTDNLQTRSSSALTGVALTHIAVPVELAELAEPASLRASDDDLIARTLQACAGNVSATARRLRVSRGLIYRRMQGQ